MSAALCPAGNGCILLQGPGHAHHHCAASALLTHLCKVLTATQQPGCGAYMNSMLRVRANQSDRVTTPGDYCSCALPADAFDAEWPQDLRHDSYLLPEGKFLPLPGQFGAPISAGRPGMADMLACSYPSPQHNPGESSQLAICAVLELVLSCPRSWVPRRARSDGVPWPHACLAGPPRHSCCAGATAELVSLRHWRNDAGQLICRIEAFLPGSGRSNMSSLTPVIQGTVDLPLEFTTVDRAGDLVAAGTLVQDAVHDVGATHMEAFSFC